uniref:Uncharacterized protein n=1 Tax=Anguilla anguilla TaxID=7936 RepID=A0A0E9PIQ7_ANGAN
MHRREGALYRQFIIYNPILFMSVVIVDFAHMLDSESIEVLVMTIPLPHTKSYCFS